MKGNRDRDYRAERLWLRVAERVVCLMRGHRPWFVTEGVWCGRCGRRLG